MQGVGETDGLEAKAKASGASELFIADLREEFVKDYIFPCLRAGAVYERKYLLGTSMARPIIAKVAAVCKGIHGLNDSSSCLEYHELLIWNYLLGEWTAHMDTYC